MKITLTCTKGETVEVEAEIYGGFGVHEDHKKAGVYRVTHVGTGLNVTGGHAMDIISARELATRYARLDIPEDAGSEDLRDILMPEWIAFAKSAGWV